MEYRYDLANNATARILPNGAEWSYSYDDIYRITNIADPYGNATQYTFDAEGNVLTMPITIPRPSPMMRLGMQ